jgi:hypothetical protein
MRRGGWLGSIAESSLPKRGSRVNQIGSQADPLKCGDCDRCSAEFRSLRVVQNPCASVVVSRHRPSPLSHFVCSVRCIGVLRSIRFSLRARGADERDAGNGRSLQPTRQCLSSVAIRQPFCRFRVRVAIVNASSQCASERRIRAASMSARGRIKSHGCTAIRAHWEGSAPQGSLRPGALLQPAGFVRATRTSAAYLAR